MKYKIGDVIQLNNLWNHLYGIIVEVDYDADNDMKYPVYRIIVQGNPSPSWLSESTILRKVE